MFLHRPILQTEVNVRNPDPLFAEKLPGALATYEALLKLTDDEGSQKAPRFLATREVAHTHMFMEALNSINKLSDPLFGDLKTDNSVNAPGRAGATSASRVSTRPAGRGRCCRPFGSRRGRVRLASGARGRGTRAVARLGHGGGGLGRAASECEVRFGRIVHARSEAFDPPLRLARSHLSHSDGLEHPAGRT